MRIQVTLLIFSSLVFNACGQNISSKKEKNLAEQSQKSTAIISNTNGNTIAERFPVPKAYQRIRSDSASFASYLRNLPLKRQGSKVKYFDGKTKPNNSIYAAVVNLPIGKRDLHQCADAVIRLRAEYFFIHKKFDSIQFNFTNGFKADYANWRNGKRIVVEGNTVSWKESTQTANPTNGSQDSEKNFWKYLEMVFSYAGTASLSKELKAVTIEEMQIGDIFIKGGFPGHAVIVVDIANHSTTNQKLFLLAQSYMPAQEIQILQNPNSAEFSPWYSLNAINNTLSTPEWDFDSGMLKRFN